MSDADGGVHVEWGVLKIPSQVKARTSLHVIESQHFTYVTHWRTTTCTELPVDVLRRKKKGGPQRWDECSVSLLVESDVCCLTILSDMMFSLISFKDGRRKKLSFCNFYFLFCFPCDSGHICRSVNIPENAGKLTLKTATWLMHFCDLVLFDCSFFCCCC